MIGSPAPSSVVRQPGPTKTRRLFSFAPITSAFFSPLHSSLLLFLCKAFSLLPQQLQPARALSCSETGSLVDVPNALNQHRPACFPATAILPLTHPLPLPPAALRASWCREPLQILESWYVYLCSCQLPSALVLSRRLPASRHPLRPLQPPSNMPSTGVSRTSSRLRGKLHPVPTCWVFPSTPPVM